jgi:cytidine deaminase
MDDDRLDKLVGAAVLASSNAYCPYSKFRVGAAVLSEHGHIYTGANIENASYGLTICAERAAIFRAVADGCRQILAVVIYTPTSVPAAPCGACRQVMREFASTPLLIHCACDGPNTISRTLIDLLPESFGPDNLGQ